MQQGNDVVLVGRQGAETWQELGRWSGVKAVANGRASTRRRLCPWPGQPDLESDGVAIAALDLPSASTNGPLHDGKAKSDSSAPAVARVFDAVERCEQ